MNFITNLLTLHNQFKVYHWQTQKKIGSYAQHVAFGTAYDELGPKIDDFIEIYQGKRGVIRGRDGFTVNLQNLDDTPTVFIDEFINYLTQNVPESLDQSVDTDLLNIRDEMLGILNQTKYRLMMK
jgi:hypothetical protein